MQSAPSAPLAGSLPRAREGPLGSLLGSGELGCLGSGPCLIISSPGHVGQVASPPWASVSLSVNGSENTACFGGGCEEAVGRVCEPLSTAVLPELVPGYGEDADVWGWEDQASSLLAGTRRAYLHNLQYKRAWLLSPWVPDLPDLQFILFLLRRWCQLLLESSFGSLAVSYPEQGIETAPKLS